MYKYIYSTFAQGWARQKHVYHRRHLAEELQRDVVYLG
jgi:hypothetical protein